MSNNSVEQLINLYNTIKSGSEQINEATRIIETLYANLGSIILHIQMYMQVDDLNLKKLAVIGIKNIISVHTQDPDNQITSEIQQWLIQSLLTETNEYTNLDNTYECLWRFLCDVAAFMVKYWPDFDYEPMYQLANQLLANENQQAIGFCLWAKIFPQDKDSITERTINLIKELFVIASQSLLNENPLIRQTAFELIDMLIWKLENQNFAEFEKNEEMMQILGNVKLVLTHYVEIIFKTNTVNTELQNFITLYSDVFSVEIPFFFNNSTPIIDAAIMAIADPEIPVVVKICIHSLISAGFSFYQKTEKSTFIILHYSIQLTLAACHENRQDDNYTFAEDFFTQVVEAEPEVLDFFGETIQQLAQSEDICNRQVALLLIKSSIASMSIDMARSYLYLALQIGDCNDGIIVFACCMIISEFISSMDEATLQVFDQLSKYLLKYARLPDAMRELSRLIKSIQQPPEFFKDLIDMLLSFLPQVNVLQATDILYCVKSCFNNFDFVSPFDPGIDCSNTIAILFSAVSLNEEYRSVVLKSLGNIVASAPSIIQQNLENIITLCRASMDNFLDPNFSAAATCIRKLTSYLPDSIARLLPQVIPPMLEIISMKVPNTNEIMLEGVIDCFEKSKCDAMKCLCLIGFEIDDFGNQYGELLWKCTNSQPRIIDQIQPNADSAENQEALQNHLQADFPDKDKNQLSMSSKILISGVKLFAKKKFETKKILILLANNLQSCDDFDTLVLVLHAIRELILFTPHESILDEDTINKVGMPLILASTGIYYGFIKQPSSLIPKILRRALFGALIALADVCREALSSSAGEYYQNVKSELAEPDKLQCAQILHFLSKIFMYCQIEVDEYLDFIFSKISETINCFQDYNNYEILMHAFISLICLFRIKKDKFANNVNVIMMYIQFFIQNSQIENLEFKLSYQTLYLTLISIYQIPINDDIKSLYNEIKVFKNMELLPFIADCFVYGFKFIGNDMVPLLARFSTILFSSEQWVIDTMNKETLMFYFNIINSIPQEELMNYCNSNESSLHQIIRNMQMCQS